MQCLILFDDTSGRELGMSRQCKRASAADPSRTDGLSRADLDPLAACHNLAAQALPRIVADVAVKCRPISTNQHPLQDFVTLILASRLRFRDASCIACQPCARPVTSRGISQCVVQSESDIRIIPRVSRSHYCAMVFILAMESSRSAL